jgi:16S rRNA (cytidine1402-2'-O)-methyltransferase
MSELVLVPTPIADDLPLEPVARGLLQEQCLRDDVLLLVEEHKVARGRWLKWGLPREAIERFQLFNEHTAEKAKGDVLKELRAGKHVFLLSDCGLPAFCDPGQNLVDLCHRNRIRVTATPFPNSIALAVALSGFPHNRFAFSGFVPVKSPEREQWIRSELKNPDTQVWMETPYRLRKLLEDVAAAGAKREIFLGMDLGSPNEKLLRGSAPTLLRELGEGEKREFVMVVSPAGP